MKEKVIKKNSNVLISFFKFFSNFDKEYERTMKYKFYRTLVLLLGLPITIIVLIKYLVEKKNDQYIKFKKTVKNELGSNYLSELEQSIEKDLLRKKEYFNQKTSFEKIKKQAKSFALKEYNDLIDEKVKILLQSNNESKNTFSEAFKKLYKNSLFKTVSIIWLPLTIILVIFKNPTLKYIFQRLIMLLFVLFGVTLVVFTILYLSPTDPALNVLGEYATPGEIAEFKALHGLDQPYLTQLLNAFKKLITLDFGSGYEDPNINESIFKRFPITFQITIFSLIVSSLIAIPAGIISAVKQYSKFDFTAMTVALIGISIPNFWLGLMLILFLSHSLELLPALYQTGNMLTFIMPAIVLGTALAASVARMTRSSMLEVLKSDYITTARAKGLRERKVILRHGLKNAIIPIITIIGLQFGGMLGGSSITERVFNIPGLGNYIVTAQQKPDIPIVLTGVVYVAFIISIVNLFVDILYAIFDPRIKAKLRKY